MVTYKYDAWGKLLGITGSDIALGELNPLRYRGYVYDTESKLYYLQSRYYNPELCRFINADDVTALGANGDFATYNIFAYCGNNPVTRSDSGGQFWNIAAGAIIGAAIGAISQITTNVITGNNWSSGVATATVAGMISGGLAASGIPTNGQIMGNAIISGVSECVNQFANYRNDPEEFSIGRAIGAVAVATTLGAVAGRIGGDGARAPGSSYKWALDNLDKASAKVAKNIYSSATTAAKVLSRAKGIVCATAKSTTLTTSIRFFAGAKVAQYGMAAYHTFVDSLGE